MKGIGDWLVQNVLSPPWTVRQGQQNGVATEEMPFAIMQIITRQRYATNSLRYNRDGSVTIVKLERMGIQVSTFGTGAGNAVSLINAMWRDPDAVEWFMSNLPGFAPLHASDPMQHPFTTAEKQYEDQWSVDLIADVHATVTKPGQSALHLGMQSITQADTLHTTTDMTE
ncbi:hypothetical protein NQF87_08695 [Bombella sp. TMW 2.2559]|uniref:Phage neck terminator protein gp12-like domain-containing protein n=1 Tax=Bombella dulcis TaxID=2967339 RepID=A0ABT3WGX3_9PROT|nr:hypothetical protein [Bombella dulcis]MCX5617039.1 hypothetical protein [Bombella dulcis]